MKQLRIERCRAARIVTAGLVFSLLVGCSLSDRPFIALQNPAQRRQDTDAQITAAVKALQSGNVRAADNLLTQAARRETANSEPGGGVAYVGRRLIGLGRPTDAARLLTAASQNPEESENPQVWAALAEAHRKAGNADEASRAIGEADRRAAALIAASGGQTGKAGREFVPRLLAVGLYHADQKNGEAALAALRQAYRIAPDEIVVQNALGYILADLGTTRSDRAEAVRLTRLAAEKAENNGIILDSYGWALFKNGDTAGARRVLLEAVNQEPNEAELRCHLGQVYAHSQMNREAAREFDRALRLEPGHEEAETALKSLPTSATPTPKPSAAWTPTSTPSPALPSSAAGNPDAGLPPGPAPTPTPAPSPTASPVS